MMTDPGPQCLGPSFETRMGYMLKIKHFTCEGLSQGCVTDEIRPRFSYSLESDQSSVSLVEARLTLNDWSLTTTDQVGLRYGGAPLKPRTIYRATLEATDDAGETASADLDFETGLLGTPWEARWISDAAFSFNEKGTTPVPMVFRKRFSLTGTVRSARIYATALGVYELELNGEKVGDEYFAPGFTTYASNLQYQTYDVTDALAKDNEVLVTVAGGWAVGAFSYTRRNRVTADRQALLLELLLEYEDGSTEVIGTDESWMVTEDGPCRAAEFYDGETYDATVSLADAGWRDAAFETIRVSPRISAAIGDPVRAHEVLEPVACSEVGDTLVYDFGQNLAGVVALRIDGRAGQVVTVRHAEVLKPDGTLNTDFLRTAKATLTYVCVDGPQEFSPRLTYMGFRYVSVEGVSRDRIEISVRALYSDIRTVGEFSCSDERLNRLQENILWGAKSNFVDIPTDCPQRDERMGWTGDIAVFSPTACFDFDMGRFLRKWLRDVRSEQLRTGGLPVTVPSQGFGFPTTIPAMAVDFWGDACVFVPWALFEAEGDVEVLRENYETMRRYVNACLFWAGFGLGDYHYIWHTPSFLHFGDWVAPDVPKMSQWQGRSRWTATASLVNTCELLARAARLLGNDADAERYDGLSHRAARAYRNVFTDGDGRLKKEFQTAYVLPIQFGVFEGDELRHAVANLVDLVEKNDYRIGTGFPGTPYILFALADNGRADVAYRMLMNTSCPSWLYEVVQGATTIWERWDGLDENGECPISNDGTDLMISYNHYASGAVGDFLYRRVAGIEPMEPGYRKFRVCPVVGGGLTSARGSIEVPYGTIASDWSVSGGAFSIKVDVPMGCDCELVLPDGTIRDLPSGHHELACAYQDPCVASKDAGRVDVKGC